VNHSVRIPAFAKVNLCLRVLRKRDDGFHELRTIFQAIGLHDVVELALTGGRSIALETEATDVPAGPENLVWRAVELCRSEWKVRGGIRVRLEKRIPVGRGLGGGSSDAAAAMIGMSRLIGKHLPLGHLMQMAASLGSDVPFFLFGGRALGAGRGEEIYPLSEAPKRSILVVSPRGISVSTADAYRWLSPTLTNESIAHKIYGFCTLCWNPREGSLPNDFEAAVFERHPRLNNIQRALIRHGAAEAALAGSGSAVFGVFRNPAQARRAARQFTDDQVFVSETLTRDECARAWRWRAVLRARSA
jgi:4-diphosphocytidyl-2-C-methyl-D-erythritol kinase